ncbi:MAG: hypothetical protein KGL39_05580 [Patescibacteria group bacterium]|nr:hypothetical protein [Patescibacteria group bacterium]
MGKGSARLREIEMRFGSQERARDELQKAYNATHNLTEAAARVQLPRGTYYWLAKRLNIRFVEDRRATDEEVA